MQGILSEYVWGQASMFCNHAASISFHRFATRAGLMLCQILITDKSVALTLQKVYVNAVLGN